MQNDCIFCGIEVKGIIKKEQILEENEKFYILLALNPVTRGHGLVIPKDHYGSLVEIPESLRVLLFGAAINLGEKLKKTLGAKAYIVRANDELYKLETGRGHVGHIHIHVVPRYSREDNIVDIPEAVSLEELGKIKGEILGK